jgi:FkbM family methyltransferase
MAANSLPRRLIKRLLAPLLTEATYSRLQAVAMARDIESRSWWEPEIELAARVLREGDSAIDIGANFGLWAYHMSRAVGRTGKVYSFEPIPFTARTFRIVARRLGFAHNVELFEKGCGERAGEVEFTIPVMETGAISAGLVHMGRNDARPGKEQHAKFEQTKLVKCEVVTIDEQLAGIERLMLLKCDIEGADLFAMRGARGTLAKHKPVVVIEITPWFLEGFGLAVRDVTGFFEELGYLCYHHDDDGRLTPTAPDAIVEDNWVFVHPDNASRLSDVLPAAEPMPAA